MQFPLPTDDGPETPPTYTATDALVVWTDTSGVILEATAGVAALLGLRHQGLLGRGMELFVSANRRQVLRAVEQAGRGHDDTLDVVLHPRGRRNVRVRIQIQFVIQLDWGSVVRWVIDLADAPRNG